MEIHHNIDNDQLINIIKTIPACVFFKDADLKYVFSTRYWEKLNLGQSGDIYGKTDREIMTLADNVEQIEATDREVLATGIGKQYTFTPEYNGEKVYLNILKEPVKDADGNIIGIVGIINDVTSVTEELSARLENEKAYQRAMREGSFLAYNVNLTADILYDDLIETMDEQDFNLLELLGMKAPCKYMEFLTAWSKLLKEPFGREFYADHSPEFLIEQYKKGRREINKESNYEITTFDGGAEEVWMEETILLMENNKGEIIAFVTLRDNTEIRKEEKKLRLQLEAAVEEAKLANKAKDNFLANTSHEIRTPMNAVVGMVEVLLRDETDPKKIEYLNNIKDSGTYLLGVINDILDFSKIESGRFEIEPVIYDVRKRVENLEILLNERIGSKNIELIVDIDRDLPQYLYGDVTRIRQVIINLVNNAIKFTEEGKIVFSAKLIYSDENEIRERISVEDTGIGIKPEDMDKLFGAFNRLDKEKTAHIEGTGLGLALSKHLVELMGSKIEVESTYGKGTTFSFVITQGIANPDDVEEKRKKEQKKEREGRLFKAPGVKVLLVEDNKINVKVFKALVAPLDMNIDVAENGLVAVNMVKENDYDLILMDHMMPVMDGVEATKIIRALDSDKKNIPILALTANAVVGVKEQFFAAGMDDFVSKPIQINDLLVTLRKYLPKGSIIEIED